ncbi:MAG: tRNA (adenosine(37)-N6)-dimethylallyltransferase MiaA [Firmicutes bacterium]|nr:tRNA (adenosine(37)-N6)-dimethylallyltransferase MiaA [Bacillota bacterium]
MVPLVVLVGPTAVGKTKLAVNLALHFGAQIISADSMQIYQSMDIGTAKPTVEERKGVPHHLIDLVTPDQAFTVVDYQEHFNRVRSRLAEEGILPLLTGGTGLYIRAVTQGFVFPAPPPDPDLRAALKQEAEEKGYETVYRRLQALDPVAAQKIHPRDLKRTLRALEVILATGRPFSAQQQAQHRTLPPDVIYLGLHRERAELYDRIDRRVDRMIAAGLVEEVASLLARGYGPELQSMQGLGYKELIPVVQGRASLPEAIELLKKRTRHYAKRQETWFRREPVAEWFLLRAGEEEKTYQKILAFLEGRINRMSNRVR